MLPSFPHVSQLGDLSLMCFFHETISKFLYKIYMHNLQVMGFFHYIYCCLQCKQNEKRFFVEEGTRHLVL